MPNDSQSLPEDVLRALVADGRTAAPADSRTRVLARLGVAAGAATLAHGSLATAAAGKAAGHSAAPAAASALGLGFAKVLVAHPLIGIAATLAVASGAGIGAYQAFEPTRAPPPAVATPQAAPAKKLESAPAAMPVPDTSLPVAPITPEPASEPLAESRTARAPRIKSPAELAPAPDLPSGGESARLAEQQTLLDQARASLRRGDGSGALAIIAGHESLYPITEFAEERAAIRILALVMSGQSDQARAQADGFRKRFPASLFRPAIEKSLAPPAEPAAHD